MGESVVLLLHDVLLLLGLSLVDHPDIALLLLDRLAQSNITFQPAVAVHFELRVFRCAGVCRGRLAPLDDCSRGIGTVLVLLLARYRIFADHTDTPVVDRLTTGPLRPSNHGPNRAGDRRHLEDRRRNSIGG